MLVNQISGNTPGSGRTWAKERHCERTRPRYAEVERGTVVEKIWLESLGFLI